MKVKPNKKIKVFNAVGMPCSAREFDLLKEGKEIALPKEVAEMMSAMGLVEITENNKTNKKVKE
tara:strand:+ start:2061 stop:2252 length:192 start_codon:yes stop_codon:yes gene_type:complete